MFILGDKYLSSALIHSFMLFKAHPLDGHLRSKTDHNRDPVVNFMKATGLCFTKARLHMTFCLFQGVHRPRNPSIEQSLPRVELVVQMGG